MRGLSCSWRSAGLCLATLTAPLPVMAQTEADWTAILLMSANYDSMQEKLSWTGASDRVNVVVLHDQDGAGMIAYAMLPDTVAGHPPGDCCPGEIQPCCGWVDIPLAPLGIDANGLIVDDGVLEKFFAFVAANYPAQRYLVSVRGQAGGPYVLLGNWGGGTTVTSFIDSLSPFTATIGRKIDVLNFGFCLSGNVDFAHALGEIADYYVGSPNFTNPPVAARWRFYRWVRTLIAAPTVTGRELALSIPDSFAEETADCIAAGHHCANTNPPNPDAYGTEPWTCSTIDTAATAAIADAAKALVCSLVGDFANFEYDFSRAVSDASFYGGYDSYYTRADLAYLAIELGNRIADAEVDQAAQDLVDAVRAAVITGRYQDGNWFAGGANADGLSVFAGDGSFVWDYSAAEYGSFPIESMWKLLLETNAGSSSVTVTGLSIDPPTLELNIGDALPITARAVSYEYGAMCAAAVDWDTSGIASIAELTASTNPTELRARFRGQGTLRAYYGGMMATANVIVTGAQPPPNPYRPPDPSLDGGCSCRSATGAYDLGLLVAVAVACRRRRRR